MTLGLTASAHVVPSGGGTLSIAQFAQVASWSVKTNPQTVTGLSWSAGDIIVAFGVTESGNATMSTPTNANLTFTLKVSNTIGGANESYTYMWTATAASSQSAQTISFNESPAGSIEFGAAVWVITGTPSGLGVSYANQAESLTSLTVTAGSVVCYGHGDWASTTGKTIATGSGTATERTDTGDAAYAVYTGDWVNTSAGAAGFGITSYTSMTVSKVAVEVKA